MNEELTLCGPSGLTDFPLKDKLIKLGLKVTPGDKAFYYSHEDGELQRAVLTHMDDFILAQLWHLLKRLDSRLQKH